MCKEKQSPLVRQTMGCGYEPPMPGIRQWNPTGYQGPVPTVCPGYTTSLPQVTEVAIARVHWGKGHSIGDSEDLNDAVVILEGAYNELQSWLMRPKDGGGAG